MYTSIGKPSLKLDSLCLIRQLGWNIHCLMPPCDSCVLMNFFLNLQQIVAAINAGIIPLGNTSNQISHWDLGSSFFFAGTVITTIGRRQLILFFNFGADCELNFMFEFCFYSWPNWSMEGRKLDFSKLILKRGFKCWTKEWWEWIIVPEY